MVNEKINILKLLVENQEETFSIRQIALKRKINYKSAYEAIQKLKEEEIVTLIKKGNITLCSFNKNFNHTVFTVESMRRNELLRAKDFKVLYSRLAAINSQFILILFGSHAKKTQTKHSDIDLLLITENPKEIKNKIALIPLNIHLTSISYADFTTMLKSKEFTVVSEAIKKNVILFGIEDYYRLIQNAQQEINI